MENLARRAQQRASRDLGKKQALPPGRAKVMLTELHKICEL